MKSVKVGIAGLGTVGSGTVNVLKRNARDIARRVGCPIEITHIGARRDNAACDTSDIRLSRDIFAVATDPDIDILVELIGGIDTARELVLTAIRNGKHVVTANKALIAEHGNEIFQAAQDNGVDVAFEASVAGGIPILKSLGEGLAANHVNWLAGIINGTGNFILTEMEEGGRAFDDVLAEAQQLGYAEADPTFDVEGIDAAHKLTILASIAFGIPLQYSKVYTEGISRITIEDVASAAHFGYRIKHLGIAKDTGNGIELRVHPTLIPKETMLSAVNGVMNAIMIDGDAVGPTLFYGAGAGAEPTASAVVADIIELGRALTVDYDERVPYLGFHTDQMSDEPILTIDDVSCSFYLRLHVQDKTGVLADVTRILSDNNVSIDALVQRDVDQGLVPIVMMTHVVREGDMSAALAKIGALESVNSDIMRIRVEMLDA
ncbi:MAG: homoserine dehydrogenase [Alcanivorax borkumensis]|uniref:Homoserine dehydrogenase n=1 Tax=Alcanivorax borkumensis (strain ATCC 700651 / DSM 11573 / NCIMB 13689 / SK2) TaxID=393595 RepID=Q0VRE4_ALCBS|nr:MULTISPECIES: homoserine dehydrogenase [Alcanivorax]OJH08511.1 MAG: homoserine dehydrogenase [Alcanivorax borkumensis]EUC69741.1 homoserine dehydrogenase [Alcanivorax sp. 97CO-5]PKG01579.1 homoserine dehydrogenase [Alcanivorax sp. 97CO-6]CAL16254.1 homoserine dehydrogenase [Alcanivorax borkumensis SK2]BAP13704.1 homoserine dehydrogenase [Alcanivorax sp. NBRC 101098]